MEIRHLRYFVTVAAELHFGRAAERLLISQPALSQQIRSLEGELGLQLLERNRRGVRLTPEGEAFLAEAKAVVRRADRAADVARALAQGATGRLRLSHVPSVAGGLPELIVREYRRRFPEVELTADSGNTAASLARLRADELDVAFVHAPSTDPSDLQWIELSAEPLVVVLPNAHPLVRRRRIHRSDLDGLPLVYFPRRNSPGFHDHTLTEVYGSPGAANIVRTEPSAERILVAVSEGVGITVLVEERAATLRYPGVTYRRFAAPEPTVPLGVALQQRPSLAARRFVELAQELARRPKPATRPRL